MTNDRIITNEEFDEALEVVRSYFNQLNLQIPRVKASNLRERRVNLEGKITNSMFNVLVRYYRSEFQIELHFSNLKDMDVNLLAAIDYNKMANFRGLGTVGILKFKQIMQTHGII